MPQQFFTSCEFLFPDSICALATMAELSGFGISAKIFESVTDPLSPGVVFGAAWCADDDASFEETVTKIAERHGGSVDCFGFSDHTPVPADFGFVETTS